MKCMSTFLKEKFLLISLLLIVFGCEPEMHVQQNEWNGTEFEFEKTFQRSNLNLGESSQLIDSENRIPFTGRVKRIGDGKTVEQVYLDGRLNGNSIIKSDGGARVEATYSNGELDGSMRIYDSDGVLRSEMRYDSGKLNTSGSD